MKVYLQLADGFEEIEAISTVDILRRADIEVQMVSIMDKKEVVGAHNITVVADILFENADYTDVGMIILPGGGGGTQKMAEHAGLKQQITKQAMEGKWIAAICAAPTILGKLGLLEGKSAACYPGCESQLTGANVSTSPRVIVDGRIITSRGPGTSFEFGLKIVEVLKGLELANRLKEQMIIA
ncbi:MAG: DJ-1/PfpI family protein [Sporomusaceae bacterium]|nr:DJ-1/PfpI family protein [Sporomusaceae bacterium]